MKAIVVRLNDFDWWLGRSLASIKRAYLKETGLTPEEAFDDPAILSHAEMGQLKFVPDEAKNPGEFRTFAEEFYLRLSSGWDGKPQLFASTEF